MKKKNSAKKTIKKKAKVGVKTKISIAKQKKIKKTKPTRSGFGESQHLLNTIFKSATDGILIAESKSRKFVTCNPMISKMLGYSVEELLNLGVNDIHPEKDLSFVVDLFSRQAKNEFSLAKNIPVKRKDQSVFYADVNSFPVKINGKQCLVGFFRDVSDRHQIEEGLRESEERFRKMADTTTTAIFVYQGAKFVYSNRAAQNISGYSQEEFLSKNFWDFVHPDFRELIKERGEARQRGEDVINNYEFKIISKDGSEKWLDFTAGIINWKGKMSAIGTAFDITKRKNAEEALKTSEEKYRNNFNNAPVGIYQSDVSGRFVFVNNKLVKMLGYDSKEELLQKSLDTDVYFDNEERQKLITQYAQSGAVADLEIKWKRKDGTPIWIQLTASAVKDSSGKIILFDGFVRDIGDSKKTEIELYKLSQAVAQSPASIVITNLNGNIEYVNKAFTEKTGYSFQEVRGRNPRFLKSGYTTSEEYKNLWDTITAGKTWHGEFSNKKKNGEFFWEDALISPVKDKDGKTINYLAVKQDVTEKKNMIHDLITAKLEAEKANRLKSEFLAQMSHEVRSPLNVVMSMSDLIREELADKLNEDQERYFEGIASAGRRIIRTVGLILNLSELQVGTYKPSFKEVNLIGDIFDEIQLEYSPIAKEKGLEFEIHSDISEPIVWADRYSLAQIFMNLVDNAVKYTSAGKVLISISKDSTNQIDVCVEDTGIGISPEFTNSIFEPFTQEDSGYTRRFEGNGLGLALVKKYCDLNNAKIIFESLKGKGSKFIVTFTTSR